MTEEEKIQRAEAARSITENPIFVEAWEVVDRFFYDTWRETKHNDVEGREAIKRTQAVAARFRDALHTIIADGDLAQMELTRFLADIE